MNLEDCQILYFDRQTRGDRLIGGYSQEYRISTVYVACCPLEPIRRRIAEDIFQQHFIRSVMASLSP